MDPFQTKFHILLNKKYEILVNKIFLKYKSPHLAILINIWHTWEDRSQTVNNDEPDVSFFHGNFWPVISQAVRKSCFSAWIPRGPNFWKPLTCGYVAAGAFFRQKRAPYFWKPLTCGYVAAGAFFFRQKRAPYFWKPLACGYVAAGVFFQEKRLHISGSP